MTTASLYETSGDWLYDIGLPGKSGIGRGHRNRFTGQRWTGHLSPLLDKAGNSVKGQLVAKHLSQQLGMDLFVSQPAALKIGCDNRRGNRDCEREGSTREWCFAIYVQAKTCFRPSLSHVSHEYFAS